MNWMQIVDAILKQEAANRYGMRNDGTPKGLGYYGELPGIGSNKGYVITENSIGVNLDGVEQEIPTIIPGLTEKELKLILSGGINESIIDKSVEHAKRRISKGMSPFAGPKDIVIPSPKFNGKK